MKRWNKIAQVVTAPGTSSPSPVPDCPAGEDDKGPAQAQGGLAEPSVRLANLKHKLALIRKNGQTNFNFEAISDLVEEARFNKSAIVDEASAAAELKQLLAMPMSQRRAAQLRELTEFGRTLQFPTTWHGTDRFRTAIWYHCLSRLKLVEFEPDQVITHEDQKGQHAYWIIQGNAAVMSSTALATKEAAAIAAQEAAAAAAAAAQEATSGSSTPRRSPRTAGTTIAPTNQTDDGGGGQHTSRLSRSSVAGNSPLRHQQSVKQGGVKSQGPLKHVNTIKIKSPRGPTGHQESGTTEGGADEEGHHEPHSPSHSHPAIHIHGSSKHHGSMTARGSKSHVRVQVSLKTLPSIKPHDPNVRQSPREHEMEQQQEDVQQMDTGPASKFALSGLLTSRVSRVSSSGHSKATGPPPPPEPDLMLALWDLFGEEALLDQPYTCNVVAMDKVCCASLSLEDYRVVEEMLAGETFESLKSVHLMLTHRSKRTQQETADLADQLSIFGLFKSMETDVRLEVCNLVEYIYCPAGFTLFEEGDKIDFCYVVLQGTVGFTKYDDKSRKQEDLGTKNTGDHFGTLMTLAAADRKRPFTAVAVQTCELAIISRIGYNRVLRKQLQGAIENRVTLLRGLAIMRSNTTAALQKVATQCQDEVCNAGSIVIDPQVYPNRIYFIMDGEAKLVWVTENPSKLPPKEEPPSRTGGFGTGWQEANSTAAERAERAAREAALNTQQQLGATTFNASNRMAGGKRRHTIELARLARGDVINGIALLGMTPIFHVVACTQLKLVSMDYENVEALLGRESSRMLRDLVISSHEWARNHLEHVLSVRQTVGDLIMDPSQHRNMQDQHLRHFMDHYVPRGVAELAEEAAIIAAGGEPGAMLKPTTSPSRLSFSDCLRLPATTVKGAAHQEPKGRKGKRESRNGLSVANTSATTAQASSTSLAPTGDPSQASLGDSETVGTQDSNASLGQQPRHHHHHLGTLVGVNAKRRRGRHMAFAGGVATAILDMTTEPNIGIRDSLSSVRSEMSLQLLRSNNSYGGPGGPRNVSTSSPIPIESEASLPQCNTLPHLLAVSLPPVSIPVYQQHQLLEDEVGASPLHSARAVANIHGLKDPQATPGMSASIHSPTRQRRLISQPHPDALAPQGSHTSYRVMPDSMADWSAFAGADGPTPLPECVDYEVAHVMSNRMMPVPEHSASVATDEQPEAAPLPMESPVLSPVPGMTHSAPDVGAARAAPPSPERKARQNAFMSPLPKLPNAPSPVLVSPALKSKVVLQPANSAKTAKFSQQRGVALVSGYLRPDGTLHLADPCSPRLAEAKSVEVDQSQQARTAQSFWSHLGKGKKGGDAHLDGQSSVVILPHMMNVYQSVLTTKEGMNHMLGHRPRSTSPAKQGWGKHSQGPQGTRNSPGRLQEPQLQSHNSNLSEESNHTATDATHLTLKALTVSLRALSGVDKSQLTGRPLSRTASRRLSRRNSVREAPPETNVIRVIAPAREHEPPLPLDNDNKAPPLTDHKLSRPTLHDIDYIIHRWGHRWSNEREFLLQQRLMGGGALPAGLSPRTQDRIEDLNHPTRAWNESPLPPGWPNL